MDMTNTISMISADFAISNIQQDHVTRNQLMDIKSTSVDEIFINKLEKGFVPSNVIERVAELSAGITNQPVENSYIEGGWGISRGICKLTFLVKQNVVEEVIVVIVGYLYGGSGDAQSGITADTRIVPVKSWQIKRVSSVSAANGMPTTKTLYGNGANILLNNPYEGQRGSVSLRPIDVVTNAQVIQHQLDTSGMIDEDNLGNIACGNSLLGPQGVIMSASENDSSVTHASKLLEAAVRFNHNVDTMGNDPMGALGDASGMPRLRECHPDSNPVFAYISLQFGLTYRSGFEGYSVGELTTVFPELMTPGFANLKMMDASRFSVLDRREDYREFGAAKYYEIAANELYFIVLSELFNRHISMVHITATNDVKQDQAHLAINGVLIFSDSPMPLADEDFELPTNVEIMKQQIITQYFARFDPYNSGIPNQIVSVDISANLIGETLITVWLNGDNTKGYSYSFAAYASNRNNLCVGTMGSSTQMATSMFQQLSAHFSK